MEVISPNDIHPNWTCGTAKFPDGSPPTAEHMFKRGFTTTLRYYDPYNEPPHYQFTFDFLDGTRKNIG